MATLKRRRTKKGEGEQVEKNEKTAAVDPEQVEKPKEKPNQKTKKDKPEQEKTDQVKKKEKTNKTEKKEKTDKTEEGPVFEDQKAGECGIWWRMEANPQAWQVIPEKTVADLVEADGFNPSALPFSLGWEKYEGLKSFYQLTDEETTTTVSC